MINRIIEHYEKYDITYNPKNKILFIHKPILVKDFVNIRNIVNSLELDVEEIRVEGW